MAELPKAPKENYPRQAVITTVVLITVGILIALFAKVIIGAIIALLGVVFGVGARVSQDKPLEK